MSIWGKIGREVAFNVASVKRECREQFSTKLSIGGRVGQQLVYPDPRKTTERNFQRASPIDPKRVRICAYPAMPLRVDLAYVLFVIAEEPCFRERDQVLMPVEFPCNFVISDFRVFEKANVEPGFQRSAFAVNPIKVPVDLRAVVEVFVAQQVKVMSS